MIGATWMPSPAWSVAGWTMLHFVWVGGLLAVLAALGRRVLRRAHPDVRYGYALASLALLAGAPAVIAVILASGSAAVVPAERREPVRPDTRTAGPGSIVSPSHETVDDRRTESQSSGEEPGRIARWAGALADVLPGVWLLGAPLTFAYLATGLLGAERLRRRSRPVNDVALSDLCERLADALVVTRRVTVGVCDRVAAPLVLGVVRPLIVLPSAVLSSWSPEQVEMALLHELAHVRRWDNLVNLIQRVVESALFFHPAVWVLSGWVRREREHCCDRIVVQHTGRARDYAGALFLLADSPHAPLATASFMADHHLVDRMRRILSPEDRTMKLSRTTLALAAALLTLPALLGTFALNANRRVTAQEAVTKATGTTAQNRATRHSGITKAAVRQRDPNAPPWQPGPVPATIPVDIAGVARDETGKAVVGAAITLYAITDKGSTTPAGKATTGADGRYVILGAMLPVTTSTNGDPLRKEITPYASFILFGLAPGRAVGWSQPNSIYALDAPNPDDIQGRLPLHQPVIADLTFPKAAVLIGKVVDENGEPVAGAKLQVLDVDLLDADGRETNNRQGYDWKALPGNIGRAVTDERGRFRIEGLADRACCLIVAHRPEADNTISYFYAATIGGPDTIHEELPPGAFNGRGRHEVKTGEFTILFPKCRAIAVTVVGDDTGKPIAGAGVATLRESRASGISSGGTTDSAGKVLLSLPPGRYQGIFSDPTLETHYIRTYQRPLVVEPGTGAQAYELRQQAGAELILEAVEAGTGKPVADVFFWKALEDQPGQTQHIEASTFTSSRPWTNAKGEIRAVLAPEPGRRYRFRFAGIHEPNMPSGIDPDAVKTFGYVAEPAESELIELAAGKSVRLRFVLRKAGVPATGNFRRTQAPGDPVPYFNFTIGANY